jgi:uncharacterized membrane protein
MDETPQGTNDSAPPPPPPPPAETPAQPPAKDAGATVSPNRSIMIVLSYFGPLALIPLLVEKDDNEVQWHAKHGLVLFVTWVVIFVGIAIVSQIPGIGCIFFLLGVVVWFAVLVISILCIVKGINGERFLIPGISEFADRF